MHRVRPALVGERTAETERQERLLCEAARAAVERRELDLETGELLEDQGDDAGTIKGWSTKSRIRMMYRFTTLDWSQMRGVPEMLTLTYPREFPADGRTVKRHLDNFRRSWCDRFGAPPAGVWKLEFQRRGAPHFHLYVGRPVMPWREFLDWARDTWYRIVGSGDPAHLEQGVRIDRQFCSKSKSVKALAWYFAKHNAKHSTKHYQNEVPEGFGAPGRFWGYWTLPVKVTVLELSTSEFVQIRRLLARLRRAKTGQRRGAPARLIGLWALSADGFGLAAQALQLVGGSTVPSNLGGDRRSRVEAHPV